MAFLQDGEKVLFARGEKAGSPFTATTNLIQGIYESRPEVARKVLRARIWATREPGPFTHGMVKVAARRLTAPVEPRGGGATPAPAREEIRCERRARTGDLGTLSREGSCTKKSEDDWLKLAASLVGERRVGRPLFELDRAVGAVLVSPDGELWAASANTNASNRTYHAEVNVLTDAWLLHKSKLPRGTRLYATLQPCKMCAGLAWELAEEPGALEVYYALEDPGPAARDSVLEVGSNARRRFARTPDERAVPCRFRVAAS